MKVVLTGCPCDGKTTVSEGLRKRGFSVISEVATAVINDGGPSPVLEHEAFQLAVLRRQLYAESRFGEASLVFHDRGAFDGIPYRQIYGRPVPDFFAVLQPRRYDVCFLLDQLPWVDDGVRYEDQDFARAIQPDFARVYEDYEIPVVRVPVATVEGRIKFILDHIEVALARRGRRLAASSVGASIRSASALV